MSEGKGLGFLQLDSPFMRFLSILADLMILNMLTLLLCIPVVTAGASFTAMHYVLLKIVRGEEGYIGKAFFKAFKENFPKSTVVWIGMVAVYAALFVDWRILRMQGEQFGTVYAIVLYAAIVVVYLISLYVFPIMSRYQNTIRGTLKMAFSMSVLGMFTLRTILNGVIFLIPAALLYFGGWSVIPVLLVFCFSAPGFLRAKLYNGLFKSYEMSPEEREEIIVKEKERQENKKKNKDHKKRFH
ncbi:MAG: YesL family protein [Lachnospiraceae bacterium]|nr:YesL family protein [Lachnospiraceae bacterium]